MKPKQQQHLLVLQQFNDEYVLDYRNLYRKYLDREIDALTFHSVIADINYFVIFDYAVQVNDIDYTCYKLTPAGVDYKNYLLELEYQKMAGFNFTKYQHKGLRPELID